MRKRKIAELSGQKIDTVTVIEETNIGWGLSLQWICECDCGKIGLVSTRDLIQENPKHLCNCWRISDMTGQRFGRLVVIGRTAKRWQGNVVWKCRCDCGKEVSIPGNRLQQGKTKSCGCLRRDLASRKGVEHPGWDPTLTDEYRRNKRRDAGYQSWRKLVVERDAYTCQRCGAQEHLVTHHIENYRDNPDKRVLLENGIVLCNTCHAEFHSQFGIRHNTRKQLDEFLSNL